MTELLTSTAIASSTLGTLELDSTPTDSVTLNYDAGISGSIQLNPLVVSVVSNYLGTNVTLPSELNVDETYTGNFTIPNDPAQFQEGQIAIDYNLLNGVFELGLIPVQADADYLDSFFNIDFTGTGTLSTETAGETDFSFQYFDDTDSIVINGFDPDVAAGTLEGESQATAEGDFSIDLVLSSVLQLDNLPPAIASLITTYQATFGDELPVGSGTLNLELNAIPSSDPLSNSTVLVSNPLPSFDGLDVAQLLTELSKT